MHDRTDEKHLSNEELIAALGAALQQEGTLLASVIAMLIEVEERRLHLELACPSMFEFSTRRLGMSEGEAYRRLTVARLARRFPQVLDAVRSRRVHLSNLVMLRDFFTPENVEGLIAAAAGKTKRAVQELVARLAPKPDAPALIRKLPSSTAGPRVAEETTQQASASPVTSPVTSPAAPPTAPPAAARVGPMASPAPPQLTPLTEARHRVQFTASSELRQKLERAQSLMRHRNVDGDLAIVVERAIDLLITKLEREKLAATARPKAPPPEPARSRVGISAAARREVVRRDDEQCSFVGSNGDRCSARDFLEIDHRHPRALGGSDDAQNLRLLCRAHNQYAAERTFGREHIANAIHLRQRKRGTAPIAPVPALDMGAQPRLPLT